MTAFLPRCLPVLLALALGPGGLPAAASGSQAPPVAGLKGALLAQAAVGGQQPLPAEVKGWADGAKAAYRSGNPAEALRLQEQVVTWLRANRGPVDAERAGGLSNLGLFLGAVGRAAEALAATEEAVIIYRKLAKSNSAYLGDLAMALNNLGNRNSAVGRWTEALDLTMEAVRLYQELSSKKPVYQGDLAMSLSNLGTRYSQLGRKKEALVAIEAAMTVYRDLVKINPAYLGDLAKTLNNLGIGHTDVGGLLKALAPTEEAVKVFRELAKSNPAYHGELAMSLNNLGLLYGDLGRHAQALEPTKEAVEVYRKLAKTNPAYQSDLAASLNNLGVLYSEVGLRSDALSETQEAVRLLRGMERSDASYLGNLAGSLNNLGLRYSQLGRLVDMLAPMEEAVAIRRKLAKSNPAYLGDLGSSLNNLGVFYSELGRRAEALPATEEAVRVYRELGESNPAYLGDLAASLNNLGVRYSQLGSSAEALAPTEEAVKIRQELAKTNPAVLGDLAASLNNLGNRYRELGRRAEALSLTEEAVRVYRDLATRNRAYLGDLAASSSNLGSRYSELGRDAEALRPAGEAVRIYRDLVAKSNPAYQEELARSTTNLADLQLQQGNPAAAIPLLREAMASEALFLQQQLLLMAEERRQALVNTLGSRWEVPFSQAQQGPAGAELALYTRLNRYAPLQDIERRQAILSRSSGAPRQLVERLTVLTAELANANLDVNKRQQAQEESQRLQAELFRQLPELKPRLVEPGEVAQRLADDGVLVELQRYSPYDPRQPEGQRLGPERYLALVLQPTGVIQAVDLGPAQPLEQAITTALTATTRDHTPEAGPAWGAVAEQVFGPLQAAIGGQRRWLIAPDGELHRVPFSALAVLAGGGSRVLPAGVSLQTIGSGRDLLPLPATAGATPKAAALPLVLANPTTRGWPDLLAADAEGAAVAAALKVAPQRGAEATVAKVQQARGPRVIHVAGHGYFDPEGKGDPLLASGLVLAGADTSHLPSQVAPSPGTGGQPALGQPTGGPDDGYLSAKEAARLQLDGTQLVVLSACETGLGNQRTGEGVFGLQRALTVAGARGTLLSLWKVPDQASRTFMERFYALLSQGLAPSAAVRQVQDEFRSQPTIGGKTKLPSWSDPYYWAAWQYSGVPE